METEEKNSYKEKQNTILVIIKLLVTSALFYWVLRQIEITPLLNHLKNTNGTFLMLALFLHAMAFLLFSFRWWYLYHAQDSNFSYRETLSNYYLGLFCNNFLPTGVGGDVIRIIRLRQRGFNTHVLVSSSLTDRILGLASILTMGLVAVLFTPNFNLAPDTKLTIFLCAVAIALSLMFLFSDYMAKIATLIQSRFNENKIIHFLLTVTFTLHEYRKKRPQVLLALFISFIAQYLIILCYITIGVSLNIQLPVSIYFTIIPIIFVATSLPISIGGIGVRESALITMFLYFQIDKQAAIALSLIYFGIVILLTLPGGLIILRKK